MKKQADKPLHYDKAALHRRAIGLSLYYGGAFFVAFFGTIDTLVSFGPPYLFQWIQHTWPDPVSVLIPVLLIGGEALISAAVAYGSYRRLIKPPPPPEPTPTTHGSAHWANDTADEQRYHYQQSRQKQSQLVLGTYKGTWLALSEEQQESHVLIVAPTGQGKTTRFIIPGLLREYGHRSLFIIDPKQELVSATMGRLAKYHRCLLFAPQQPASSHTYNPLAHIHTLEDAQDFAACWVANTGKSQEPFWDRSAELLITATVLHIRKIEPDAPLSRLADMLVGMPYQQLKDALIGSPAQGARDVASAFLTNLALNERLAGSILTDIANRFFLLRSENIQTVTASNELDFSKMVDAPTALYLSIPASAADRLRPLSACLLMQMFAAWQARAEASPRNRLTRPIACYLDEFANAGTVPHMARRISMFRSSRVALILAIQNFAQLDDVYNEDVRKTILANTTTHLVLPGVSQDEAEYYSRRCGDTTIHSTSKSTGWTAGNWQETTTRSEARRPLITPDEVRRLPKGAVLMVSDNAAPMIIANRPYYDDSDMVAAVGLPYDLPHRNAQRQSAAPPGAKATSTTTTTPAEDYHAPE